MTGWHPDAQRDWMLRYAARHGGSIQPAKLAAEVQRDPQHPIRQWQWVIEKPKRNGQPIATRRWTDVETNAIDAEAFIRENIYRMRVVLEA